jgi:sugar phosphate isomerase/epimerase
MALQLGCSTILYGGYSLQTAVHRIAKTGYKSIELCAIPGMAPHFSHDLLKAEIVAIKALVDDAGLAIESIGGSGNLGDIARFQRLLDAAAAVGAPAVTTGSTGKADVEEDFVAAVKHVEALIPHAKSVGVRISIKPHVGAAIYNTATALRFMKEVDAEAVGINWDASHIWRTPDQEDPVASLRKLKRYVATLRIRDTLGRERPIGPVPTQVPGGGAMPLARIAKEMNTIKHLRHVVVEIVGTKDFALDDVQKVVDDTFAGLAPLFPAA